MSDTFIVCESFHKVQNFVCESFHKRIYSSTKLLKPTLSGDDNSPLAPTLIGKLVELLTVHPNDRIAHQIALTDQAHPPNTELGRPRKLGLPPLSELGTDLLTTSPLACAIVIGRPFALVALYFITFNIGWWPVAIALTPYIYLTVGAAVHDLIHKSLGVPDRLHGILLAVVGALALESGHALSETHQVHHRKLHTSVDPEGYVDDFSMIRTLGEGPFYKHYLACWVLKNRPNSRPWVVAEALWAQGTILAALVLGWNHHAFGVYIGLIVLGSWLFPFVGVKLVHSDPGDNVLGGTVTLRGRIISVIGCGLTFHLEHHLYPRVPGHKLRHLAPRLDERLDELGVEPVQIV